MSEWYECSGSGRNTTGASLTIFGEKGYLIGGTASSMKKKSNKGVAATNLTCDSPWLQVDHVSLPSGKWNPVIVNSGGLLNRAYHASAGLASLDNRVFVFGGNYTACPDEIATDVLEIETSSIFGVQATLCEGASSHDATACKGLSCSVIGSCDNTQKIVLFGGSRSTQSTIDGQCSNDLYLFHPQYASSSWTPIPIIDEETGEETGEMEVRPDVYIRLEAGEDEEGNVSCPCPRAHHTCVTAGPNNDKLLLYGGQASNGDLLSDVWLCDLSAVVKSFQQHSYSSSSAVTDKREDGEERDEGNEEEEKQGLVSTVIWTCLSEGSETLGARFLHSSFAYMKPTPAGCDIDPCLYLCVFGGTTTTGYAAANEVYTAQINLEPDVEDPDDEGNGGCDGSPAIVSGSGSGNGDFIKNASSLSTGAPSTMHMSGAAVGLLSTTPESPVSLVMVFNGNNGSLTVTDDSVELALSSKKECIRRIKEAKAAAAAASKSAIQEEEQDTSGLPSKVSYANGDIYQGELKLPTDYVEGDPIVPINCIRSGKGKMTYKETGEIYEGQWVDGQRVGFGTSQVVDEDNRLTRFEGQFAGDARHGSGELRLVNIDISGGGGDEESKGGTENNSTIDININININSSNKEDSASSAIVSTTTDPALIFVGNWEKGFMNGNGTLYYANGDCYKGNFVQGKRHGRGSLIPGIGCIDSPEYTGDWVDDKIAGNGEVKNYSIPATDIFPGGIYEGMTVNGAPSGKGGYCAYTDGSEYLGEWKHGRCNGFGKQILPNMDIFEGKFIGNVRNGYGTLVAKSGAKYEGLWENGKENGEGKRMSPSGEWIEGIFVDGELREIIPQQITLSTAILE